MVDIAYHCIENTRLPIVRCSVKIEKDWDGNDQHPLKSHPLIQGKTIPIVLLVKGDKILARLDQYEQFKDYDLLEAIAEGRPSANDED